LTRRILNSSKLRQAITRTGRDGGHRTALSHFIQANGDIVFALKRLKKMQREGICREKRLHVSMPPVWESDWSARFERKDWRISPSIQT